MRNRSFGALVLLAGIAGFGATASAQAPMAPQLPKQDGIQERSVPVPETKEDKDRRPNDESLSNELARTNGVVAPPPTGDEEIHKPAPVSEPNSTPVIPPPGTPGADQRVQPK